MTISNSNHDPYGTRDRARLGARSRTVSIKRISMRFIERETKELDALNAVDPLPAKPPEEQIPPPAPAVAEQPAKVKPAKVKPSTKPAPVVAEPIAEQPAPKSARRVRASSKGGA